MVFLNLPEKERAAVWRLFWYCLLTGSSYTLARTAADSLFLSRLGGQDLPWAYVFAGVATWVGGMLWFRCVCRLPLQHLLVISTLLMGLASVVAWYGLPYQQRSFQWLAMIYVLAELKGCLNAINVVVALNEVFGGRASRKAWAASLSGFPVAALLAGVLIGWESQYLGVPEWLWISACLDILALVPIWWISHCRIHADTPAKPPAAEHAVGPRATARSSLTFWMAWFVGLQVVVVTMTNFEWKLSLGKLFGDQEALLSTYFGFLYAALGLATLSIQVFATGKFLDRRRSRLLMTLPIAMFLLALAFTASSGLVVGAVILTTAKAWDAWRRSAHDTTLYWSYTHLRRDRRRESIGHNLATIKPLAEVATALALVLLTPMGWTTLWLASAAGWLWVAYRLIRSLHASRRGATSSDSLIKQLTPGLLHDH